VHIYHRFFYLIFVVVSSRDKVSQDQQKMTTVAHHEFIPEGMSDSVAHARSITVVTASKQNFGAHDEDKLTGIKFPMHLRLYYRSITALSVNLIFFIPKINHLRIDSLVIDQSVYLLINYPRIFLLLTNAFYYTNLETRAVFMSRVVYLRSTYVVTYLHFKIVHFSPLLFNIVHFSIAAVSSPESMPHDKKSTRIEHEEFLLSTSSRKPKIANVGANQNHTEKICLESSFDVKNDENAQLSPTESNDVVVVVSMKDSRGRKKVTSDKKQKIKLGNSLMSAAKDVVYASPIMRIPIARPIGSKRSLTRVESAKSVTSIARNRSTLSHPGNENVDPQSSLGWSSNLKLENSTNARRRTKKAQKSPVTVHTKPTRNMRSPTSAVNYGSENSATIPLSAVSGCRIATEGKAISVFKTHAEDLLPLARMRSGASVDSRKRKYLSKTIPLHPNDVFTATKNVADRPEEIFTVEACQQPVNIGYRSQSHSDIVSDHTSQGQNEEDIVFNDNELSSEAPNKFQKITASWRAQNFLTSPSKTEIESFVIGVSVPMDNIDLRNDYAAKTDIVNAPSKIEHDSSSVKGPLDVSLLLSKNRGRNYEMQRGEAVTPLNDSTSKSNEDSSPKDRVHVDFAVDKSDDGEPSSDEDGVIAM
jgi:hypothetical protein